MNAELLTYLDASALAKLAIDEAESIALREHLADGPPITTSALARVEVPRAVRRHGSRAVRAAGQILDRLDLMPVDVSTLDAAAKRDSTLLHSLDAVHVASALSLGDDLAEVITYDRRVADAATALGLRVTAPA